MATPLQALPLPVPLERPVRVSATRLGDAVRAVRPLMPAAAAAWLGHAALVVLLCSPAIRVFDAGALPAFAPFAEVSSWMASTPWLHGGFASPATLPVIWLYVVIVGVACASWWWALRAARGVTVASALPVVVLTAVIAMPLLIAPGLTSDDVYLYNAYGRTIAVHDANPVLAAPSAFPHDPHLAWVHWKELPSSYGPVWLMLSALVSQMAGGSLTATVILYRVAGLALHLLAVVLLWRVLREHRPAVALAGTLFYAWNPLVLHEVVLDAHNDVLVAVFAIPLVGAAMHRQWSRAAGWAACAVMVKPFAVMLVPAVARRMWQCCARRRYVQLALAAVVGATVALTLSVPLWSGDALIRNALENPAATSYTNSLWELVAGPDAGKDQAPQVNLWRTLAFVAGAIWVLARRGSRMDVAQRAVWLWLVFCVTASWVWPWYFVPALALAPLAGVTTRRLAAAVTVGGLLFWAAWPDRQFGDLSLWYQWRSVLLFGPVVVTALWMLVTELGRVVTRGKGEMIARAEPDQLPVEVG